MQTTPEEEKEIQKNIDNFLSDIKANDEDQSPEKTEKTEMQKTIDKYLENL